MGRILQIRENTSKYTGNPSSHYKDKDWKGFGDWLGTGTIAPSNKVFRPFAEAREFVRSLGLKTKNEYVAYAKSGRIPANIPLDPNSYYKDKGWNGFADFLGTTRQWLDFEKAREYARSLGLKVGLSISNTPNPKKRPADMPLDPHSVYKDKGWERFCRFFKFHWLPFKKQGHLFIRLV